jgi:hypothetical protein
MAAKLNKVSKKGQDTRDEAQNRKFLIVVAIITVALMLVMYMAFR